MHWGSLWHRIQRTVRCIKYLQWTSHLLNIWVAWEEEKDVVQCNLVPIGSIIVIIILQINVCECCLVVSVRGCYKLEIKVGEERDRKKVG